MYCGQRRHLAGIKLRNWIEESGVSDLRITIGTDEFDARFERKNAPDTCAAFVAALPFSSKIVHVRWSGFAVWIPLGKRNFDVGFEDPVSYPAPGQILLYPGGISETEILIPYGPTCFASKVGQLAGNHFLTITGDIKKLETIGSKTLWEGASDIRFEAN